MKSSWRPYLINLLFLGAALTLSVAAGPVFIPPGAVIRILAEGLPGISLPINWPVNFETIIYQIRLPHAVLILLTGAALGGSGAAYQGVFRNPLADPYLIGVASGAGLGAVIAMAVSWPGDLLGLYAIPIAAFIGAIITIALVYSLARVGKSLPTTTLILAGVAVSAFASSLTSFFNAPIQPGAAAGDRLADGRLNPRWLGTSAGDPAVYPAWVGTAAQLWASAERAPIWRRAGDTTWPGCRENQRIHPACGFTNYCSSSRLFRCYRIYRINCPAYRPPALGT